MRLLTATTFVLMVIVVIYTIVHAYAASDNTLCQSSGVAMRDLCNILSSTGSKNAFSIIIINGAL